MINMQTEWKFTNAGNYPAVTKHTQMLEIFFWFKIAEITVIIIFFLQQEIKAKKKLYSNFTPTNHRE